MRFGNQLGKPPKVVRLFNRFFNEVDNGLQAFGKVLKFRVYRVNWHLQGRSPVGK